MGFLKSYLAPGKAKKEAEEKKAVIHEKQAEAAGPASAFAPKSEFPSAVGTPGNGTTPWGSRPASLYPNDQRKSQMDELNDIKCDVMVNWLYHQQMEALWTAGGQDEGVILKKSKGQYTCCPADIVDEPFGFFKAIQTLNVRVSASTVPFSTSAC